MWLIFSIFIVVEPTLYKTHSFFLWDRLVLLTGIPIVILAYDGIKVITGLNFLKALGQDALTIILIAFINYSSFAFAFTKHGIDNNIPSDVSMPSTLIWNSVGQLKKENFDQAINYLSSIESPCILIADNRYSGLLTLRAEQLSKVKIFYTYGETSANDIIRKLYDSYDPENNEKIFVFGANEVLDVVNHNTVFSTQEGLSINKLDLGTINWDKFKND
jgi:hypothetical protein